MRYELEGMSEGMAEVEDSADSLLAFVAPHDVALDRDAAAHRIKHGLAGLATGLDELRYCPCHAVEKRGVGDDAVLEHLGEAGAQFRAGEGLEHERIDDHRAGLVEGANEVLAGGNVHPGLAAHRRVDHREEGGRHMGHRDAAHVGGGNEAGEVGGDSAAQRDDGAVAAEAGLGDVVGEARPAVARLVLLAAGEGEDLGGEGPERLEELLAEAGGDVDVGDDRVAMGARRGVDDDAGRLEDPRRDRDRIAGHDDVVRERDFAREG